ncbi:MAG TPA: TIGR00730 family Rossman fold protein [Baekduia sp.]|nr:TIGR00730 family Rossman fold protein [Baekduia sp.]
MTSADRVAATSDEELLGTKRRSVQRELTEDERLERIDAELRKGFDALRELGPAVTIFGSARTPENHPDYALARETASLLGQNGYAIITGGGPGIMEAGNRGAQDVGATSVGLNIELPFEQAPNRYQDIELNFHYFFTRKVIFVRYATAFVVFPGGFGTLDELFEALVLEQTDKITDFPVVLVGTQFWGGLVDWIGSRLVDDELISASDPELLVVTDDPADVVEAINRGRQLQEVV